MLHLTNRIKKTCLKLLNLNCRPADFRYLDLQYWDYWELAIFHDSSLIMTIYKIPLEESCFMIDHYFYFRVAQKWHKQDQKKIGRSINLLSTSFYLTFWWAVQESLRCALRVNSPATYWLRFTKWAVQESNLRPTD